MMTIKAKLATFALHDLVATKIYGSSTWTIHRRGQQYPRLRYGKQGPGNRSWYIQHFPDLNDLSAERLYGHDDPALITKWMLQDLPDSQIATFLSFLD